MAACNFNADQAAACSTPQQAQYSGKYCICSMINDFHPSPIISPLYDTCEEALEALPEFKSHYPGAHVSYWPTKEWLEEKQRQNKELQKYDVRFWYVAQDRPYRGKTLRGDPLSSYFRTRRQAREALSEIRGGHPNAYIMQCRAFFHPDDPHDMAKRADLLATIV